MASIGSWADYCEKELEELTFEGKKEEEKKEEVAPVEEKGKEEAAQPTAPKKNLFDEVEKLNKAVHAGLFFCLSRKKDISIAYESLF